MYILNAKHLGQKIRTAREEKGLSQEDLAMEIGLDQRGVSQLESGKRRLSVSELPSLAKALEVPIMYFFDEETNATDLDAILLKEFHQLPSSKWRQTAINMIQLLSETLRNSR
jgi:transcriptional regulator with XRE-family HTH domain